MSLELLLLNGSRNKIVNKVVKIAASEVSKANCKQLNVKCLGRNIEMYNLVKEIEEEAYNPLRDQIKVEALNQSVWDYFKNYPYNPIILATDKDLYSDKTNYCLGATTNYYGKNIVIISQKRIEYFDHLIISTTHELGHVFGAASKNRKNTEENLGIHCTNPNCVMQQKINLNESIKYARRIYTLFKIGCLPSLFCKDCQNDIWKNT